MLSKNISFNKNEMESEMENPTYSFRETKLALQLILESQIKSKTVMNCSSPKKKVVIFCTADFVLCFVSMYSVFNTLSEYILKIIASYIFLLVF